MVLEAKPWGYKVVHCRSHHKKEEMLSFHLVVALKVTEEEEEDLRFGAMILLGTNYPL